MRKPGGPFKTPPPSNLPPRSDAHRGEKVRARVLRGQGEAAPVTPEPVADFAVQALTASSRSSIPAFEVMRITDEIARMRAAGRDVVSLCAGEPSARPNPGALSAAGYTGPLGTTALREEISGHYRRWYDIEVDPARIAVTTGSSGAFQLAFLAAFDADDKVALASPGYPAYRNILSALGVQVIELACGPETRYQPTPELLEAAVAQHGPLAGLIIASPANPTGTMLGRAELAVLASWCGRHGVRLVSDEIYHGITFAEPGTPDHRGATALAVASDAIVINSFSKYWGMTGWRLGWAILPEDLLAPFEALASNFALSPPAPAQELAFTAFTDETYAERDAAVEGFARARALLLEAEPQLRWGNSAPSDGAFYFYADLGSQLERFGSSVTYAQALLAEADVAVVPGIDFDPVGGARTVRLSYAAGEAAVAEAIERILRFQN